MAGIGNDVFAATVIALDQISTDGELAHISLHLKQPREVRLTQDRVLGQSIAEVAEGLFVNACPLPDVP